MMTNLLERYLPVELVSEIKRFLFFPALDKRMINELNMMEQLNNYLDNAGGIRVVIDANNAGLYKLWLNGLFSMLKRDRKGKHYASTLISIYVHHFELRRVDTLLSHQVCRKKLYYVNRIYKDLPKSILSYDSFGLYERYLCQQNPVVRANIDESSLIEFKPMNETPMYWREDEDEDEVEDEDFDDLD
jgi:hypothetical protein